MSIMRFAYTLLLYALLPRAVLHLWIRSRRQPEYREHIAERFGRYTVPVARPLIWVHAVSVGETRAAQPLITALRRQYPDHRILLTHMTPTGRATPVSPFGDDVLRCYLPYDFPFAAKRFLAYFNPAFGVLLETEIWPNLIRVSRQRGVPIFLIAARLSEKSFRNYFRFRSFAAEVLNNLAGIGAQSAADAGRLKALGATAADITGNLKFDIAPPFEQVAQGLQWKRDCGSRPILLCASTREGEEAPLLDALANVNVETVLIVIVPRHPQRFDEVARLIEGHGLNYQRRSANQPIAEHTRVLLGDTMGEMFAYYAACDVAIIGGSLLPFGAQNLIEACAVGRPVIVGPHTYNFAEATELAIDAGAAIKVDDVSGAVSAARELLVDRVRAEEMGHRGLEFARAHRGATERSLALIKHGIASAADARDTRRKRA